ncbi:MAG: hypothetical protein MJH11_10035 [Lentisphaeria bacterium]|nr:hypothetical protein [Lentisphaeria bacterium]
MVAEANLFEEFWDTTTIVIRSVGERTVDLCEQNLRDLGFTKIIRVENVKPLCDCLRKAMEIGIEENRKWTLNLDADVLVRARGLHELLKLGQSTPEDVFAIQAQVLCKFFGEIRDAGNHLYRTEYIKHALNFIPKQFDAIRPESDMINAMNEAGYLSMKQNPITLGLHDFEQYYCDIYRKAFIHAFKHKRYYFKLIPFWRSKVDSDPDYHIALKGFSDAIMHLGDVSINKDQQQKQAEIAINELSLKEKDSLSCLIDVDDVINNFDITQKIKPKHRAANTFNELSGFKYLRWKFGCKLDRVVKFLHRGLD